MSQLVNMIVWPSEAVPMLQDRLHMTACKEAAMHRHHVDLEEYIFYMHV